MRRRTVLGLLPLALGAAGLQAAEQSGPDGRGGPVPLPVARSLAPELAAALALHRPLVVMVSLDGCPWCTLVRANYLAPLRREDRLAVVQVDMRSTRPVRDFGGIERTHDQLVRAWGVDTAPTLLFFGRGAHEVAPRLVGASSDFYGAYLEQRLQQAQAAVTASN